jgi:hypothetical protein
VTEKSEEAAVAKANLVEESCAISGWLLAGSLNVQMGLTRAQAVDRWLLSFLSADLADHLRPRWEENNDPFSL